jgi:phospholipid N-methyltransferase
MDPKTHWETIYRTKDVHEVSWFQAEARRSLDLITRICPDRSAPIIDVGAGASVLVDNLLDAGYRDLSVLDLSEAALEISRARLGADSPKVKWMRADVLRARLDEGAYAVWHDRAVFHLLPLSEGMSS